MANFSDISAFLESVNSPYKAIQFCQTHELIRSQPPVCTACNLPMTLIKDTNVKLDAYVWRCPTHRRKISIRKDSWFAEARLSLEQCLKLIYFWSYDIRCGTIVNGVAYEMLPSYLDEFLFRDATKGAHPFQALMDAIRENFGNF